MPSPEPKLKPKTTQPVGELSSLFERDYIKSLPKQYLKMLSENIPALEKVIEEHGDNEKIKTILLYLGTNLTYTPTFETFLHVVKGCKELSRDRIKDIFVSAAEHTPWIFNEEHEKKFQAMLKDNLITTKISIFSEIFFSPIYNLDPEALQSIDNDLYGYIFDALAFLSLQEGAVIEAITPFINSDITYLINIGRFANGELNDCLAIKNLDQDGELTQISPIQLILIGCYNMPERIFPTFFSNLDANELFYNWASDPKQVRHDLLECTDLSEDEANSISPFIENVSNWLTFPFSAVDTHWPVSRRGLTKGLEIEVLNHDITLEVQTPPSTNYYVIFNYLSEIKENFRRLSEFLPVGCYWTLHINFGLTLSQENNLRDNVKIFPDVIYLLFFPYNTPNRILKSLDKHIAALKGTDVIKRTAKCRASNTARLEIKVGSISAESDLAYLESVMQFIEWLIDNPEKVSDISKLCKVLHRKHATIRPLHIFEERDDLIYSYWMKHKDKLKAEILSLIDKAVQDPGPRKKKTYIEEASSDFD